MRLLFFPILWYSRSKLRRRLAGKTVLVTGASYGVGECLVEHLATSGAHLLLVARTEEKLLEVKHKVEAEGGRADVFPCDLSNPVAVQELLARLLALPNGIDVVVSNAGRSIRRSLFDSLDRLHDFTRTMNLNYVGPVQLLLGLIPVLVARRGHIINISTGNAVLLPAPMWAAYGASKAALDHWFRSVGPELAARGVATTSIYLPLVRTRMSEPTEHLRRLPAMQPGQAASVICRAINSRRRRYRPWWLWPAEFGSVLFRGPFEALATRHLRRRPEGDMLDVLQKLHRTGLLTLPGVCRIFEAVATTGINMMSMLRGAAKLFPRRVAITDDREAISYRELWHQAETLAAVLHAEYGIRPRQKVMLACRNHAAAVKAIFAFNRLGAHLYFVDPEVRSDRLRNLEERLQFDFHVYDEPLAAAFAEPPLREKSLPAYQPAAPSIDRLARQPRPKGTRLKRVLGGDVVLMTGGTTGVPKTAGRKPSLFDFLPPFAALLTKLDLGDCRSFYIPPPIHHSYGLSALVIGVLLGAEMHFTERFDAAHACERVARHRIDAMAAIPVILRRMLRHDPGSLRSLRRIVCGSDTLPPALAAETQERLGPVLFNLYGTAEGGMISMAGPAELQSKPGTVGRPIRGVRFRLLDASESEVPAGTVGRVCVRSSWTMNKKAWIETGDLAYRDADGYLFLSGRVDDMIVSGGENIYPVDLENVLVQHPDVAAAAIVGIPDVEFGQRLKAVVVLHRGRTLDKESLVEWLRPRIARHQMPAKIDFRDDLPYTSVGKPDKRALCG